MKLTETLRCVGRRWYVVALGLVLTLAMAMAINIKVPTTYEATSSILLMPPEATVGVKGNPYLWLDGLNTALDVLVRRTSAIEVSGPLLNAYPDAAFTVTPDRTTSSAIVLISAEASSPKTALNLMNDGMSAVTQTLTAMQDESSVKGDLRIHSEALVVVKEATPKTKTRMQLLIFVSGGGIFGTLLLASFIDGWILDRQRRRDAGATLPLPADPAKARRQNSGDPASGRSVQDRPAGAGARSETEPGTAAEQNSETRNLESPGTPLKVP